MGGNSHYQLKHFNMYQKNSYNKKKVLSNNIFTEKQELFKVEPYRVFFWFHAYKRNHTLNIFFELPSAQQIAFNILNLFIDYAGLSKQVVYVYMKHFYLIQFQIIYVPAPLHFEKS